MGTWMGLTLGVPMPFSSLTPSATLSTTNSQRISTTLTNQLVTRHTLTLILTAGKGTLAGFRLFPAKGPRTFGTSRKACKDRFVLAGCDHPATKGRFQPWIKVIPTGLESQHGTTLRVTSGEITAKGINPANEDYRADLKTDAGRIRGPSKVFKDAHHGNGRYGRGVRVVILTNAKLFRRERGRQLLHEIPLSEAIADFEAKPKAGERYGKVRDTLDDDPRNGWTTHDDPESSFREAIFVLRDPLTLKSNEELVWVMMHRSTLGDANVGKFALLTTTQAGQALRSLEPSPVEQFIELAPAQSEAIPPTLRKDLYQQFLAGDSLYQQEKRVYDQFASHHREMEAGHKIQKVMVLGERSEPRQAHVLCEACGIRKGSQWNPMCLRFSKGKDP